MPLMDQHLRNMLPALESKWGAKPRCVLAYQSTEDEHWQIFNPIDQGAFAIPRIAVDNEGAHEIAEGMRD